MRDIDIAGKSAYIPNADVDVAAVRPGDATEATFSGAGKAGPRVDERAEARQHRDASAAKSLADFNAADITTPEQFIGFLCSAGFSRAFAKNVTDRSAFKLAAEPSVENSTIVQAIRDMQRRLGAANGKDDGQ